MRHHEIPTLSPSQFADFLDDPVYWYELYVEKNRHRSQPSNAVAFAELVQRMIRKGGPDHVTARIPDGMEKSDQAEVEMLPYTVAIPSSDDPQLPIEEWKRHVRLDNPNAVFVPTHQRQRISSWAKFCRMNHDKLILDQGEENLLENIWLRLKGNDFAREILKCDQENKQLNWIDRQTGIGCRANVDVIHDRETKMVVTWKMVADVSFRSMQREFHTSHFDVEQAFCLRGVREVLGEDFKVAVVAIEHGPNHRIAPMVLSEKWVAAADQQLSLTIEAMQSFDMQRVFNQKILTLDAPIWSDQHHRFGRSA